MKNFVSVFTLMIGLLFTACQEEEPVPAQRDTGETLLHFSLNIPDYKVNTRSVSYENAVTDVWLVVFDANGLFLERVHATQLTNTENNGQGTGSFQAKVSDRAGIIHFVANCDQWGLFDDRASWQKDERELMPALSGSKLIFWGRLVVNSLADPLSVTLYRNQAKVSVENEASNFDVTGYAVCNTLAMGTAAPFNPDAESNPFVLMENRPTIPAGTAAKLNQTAEDCTLTPKYLFENENYFDDQIYVIIKGTVHGTGKELYYKIQLLDVDKQPYPVVRNCHYKIVIKSFSEQANGSPTFEDAMMAESSNNIYAEIFKESPSISDNDNNVLTVSAVNFLFIQGGTLNAAVHYTKNGVPADDEITVSVMEDRGAILSALSYNGNGRITANIAKTTKGQRTATISVKAGVLSRTITIVSSALYLFTPVSLSPELYMSRDEEMTLRFTIPSTIPYTLFPLKCVISTQHLYPVEPNKNLQIEYADNTYKYVYWADGPGTKSLKFKTSLENSDETVTIENDYFRTASVLLQSRHFANVSVNGDNLVNYGRNSVARLSFTIPDYPDFPAAYPLTVFVATKNLQTSQSGWTAVNGGYTYTYSTPPSGPQQVRFTSITNASRETIVISAPGFSHSTMSYDNVLSAPVTVASTIRAQYGNTIYTLPRYRITSSDTNIVSSFTTTRNSTYSFTLKAGARLSDTVTLSYSTYMETYTVEQLLQNIPIVLRR